MKKIASPITALIFIISFGVTYSLEKFYDHHRMFDQIDTMFDADTTDYVVGFSSGWMGPTFRHPFAGMIFAPPIRAVSKITHKITGIDDFKLRREFGLMVIPFFQGMKNVVLFLLLAGIGVAGWQAILLCSLNLFAFSTVTVGSIPESFAISSMLFVLFAWFMTRDFTSAPGSPRLWQWIAAGSFAAGVTITNIVPLAIFHFLGRRLGQSKSWWDSLRQSMTVCVSSMALALGLGAALSVMFSYPPSHLLPFGDRGDMGFSLQKQHPGEELTVAAASTFAAVIQPGVYPNIYLVRKGFENGFDKESKPSLMIMFTYGIRRLNNWISISWAALFTLLLIVGIRRAYIRGPVWSSLIIASLALLIFNFALHRFFYLYDMFLYAPHWQVPMIFALSGLTPFKSRKSWGTAALATLTTLSVISGIMFLAKVSTTLSGLPPIP